MNIGDYVRYKNLNNNVVIGKIIKKNSEWLKLESKKGDYEDILVEEITKSSPNIIDLIEVGDYVNGYPVADINYEEKYFYIGDEKTGWLSPGNCDLIKIYFKNIKSIVTKEVMTSIEYKV